MPEKDLLSTRLLNSSNIKDVILVIIQWNCGTRMTPLIFGWFSTIVISKELLGGTPHDSIIIQAALSQALQAAAVAGPSTQWCTTVFLANFPNFFESTSSPHISRLLPATTYCLLHMYYLKLLQYLPACCNSACEPESKLQ